MSEICQALHELFRGRQRHRFPFNTGEIPPNGIYVLFEEGEHAHGGSRIVRVGSHTGDYQLPSRLTQHFLLENKDRSIFRKNIGRALLNRDGDPFLAQWELDLTPSASKKRYADVVDFRKQAAVEREVSQVIQSSFSFVVLAIDDKGERLMLEGRLIASIAQCRECKPSPEWLGRYSPKPKIRASGLWQEQHLDGVSLTEEEAQTLMR